MEVRRDGWWTQRWRLGSAEEARHMVSVSFFAGGGRCRGRPRTQQVMYRYKKKEKEPPARMEDRSVAPLYHENVMAVTETFVVHR